ncbi:MAG: Rieske (2Fe-2S) protein [Pleurocapsa sp. SU_196_0]|nr:Rieske (2Fe-2S) protein [Pleurocapsa sp. SU_196_0]
MTTFSRREALSAIAVTGTSLTLTGCMPQNSNPGAKLPASGVRVGALSDFPRVGSFKELDLGDTPTVVIRTAKPQTQGVSAGEVNLVALSKVCTHLGCLVNAPKGETLGCACHGSLFDANTGAVKNGPAGNPLPSFKLEIRADGVFAIP